MSWITDRDAKTQANYRYIDFEGARILQTRELEDFEATEALRDKWNNMALFREGALVNVKGTYAGLTVTLSKVDATSATPMLVLVNGSFEAIPAAAAAIPVAQAKVNATDPIYLHWVLWKVTYDGANGTIADNTLVDASTNEPVGARGQLQLKFSLSSDLSDEPLNPATMLAKSTAAVAVADLIWDAQGAATVKVKPLFNAFLSATTTGAGLVKMTDAAAGIACGNNDSRLSDTRVPTDASVYTAKVSVPDLVPEGTPASAIGTRKVAVAALKGIAAARLFFSQLEVTVEEILSWLHGKVVELANLGTNHEGRIAALEGKEAPTLDLSYHVGKDLGRPDTHPTTARSPFVRINIQQFGSMPGVVNTYAFEVRNAQGELIGGIKDDGNLVLAHPVYAGQLGTFNSYYALALWCRELARNLQNAGIPIPPGAPLS